MDIEKFDYVVVGAGAAGCIVASRLSEDGRNRVLLLEAGPRDTALGLKMPAAFGVAKMMLPFKWGFETEPEPGLVNRRLPLRMGRVIGGSSSVNGMCYHRGHPGIYDHWENLGCSGWGYSDVLPYFLKAETNHARQDEFHGQEGPMHITAGDDSESGFSNELDEAFINSGLAMGLQRTYDFDGSVPEGIGYEDRTIYKGVRMSTSRAYLSEAGKRSNLTVRPDSTVIRLTGESDKLSSVEYEYKGKKKVAAAEKEIVLCAGALMTPHILMHSGVGHADVLEKYGISVKKELSGVGQNLQNHPDVVCSFAINKPVSSNRFTHGLGSIVAGLQWLLFKRGPVASNHFVASAFIRTKPDIEFPDIKLTFLPCCLKDSGEILCKHGFQIDISLTQPTSPGTVQIGSADPKVPPKIALNY
ncbi:MAG: GMC family oxidoreductase N-terminal domain-containing protein, partial [Lacipirellulaceae bacterium]